MSDVWECRNLIGETSNAVAGVCPEGSKLIDEDSCCLADSVFDVNSHACKSEPMPAIGKECPYGFILVANEGCCPNSDAYAKESTEEKK
ncbi:hypothetical protein CRE_06416 [Caenorhabditis remanei]|uniref:CC domain-containing protein n=1 Tax=Caenorhabditis remanei TaxID=31234 RepID=E3M0T9_CAERE|nr:hypothetical protein CRE_06416 [Caenorhabditis remanei]